MTIINRKPPFRIEPAEGQESVWDYPRPPRIEPVTARIRVEFGGVTIADTTQACRVLETASPPTYYIPPADVRLEYFTATTRTSMCEWKGQAKYWTVQVGEKVAKNAVWSYPKPVPNFAPIREHLAFYVSPMDACYVGDELVIPQPGSFYGGWITANVIGPFKGDPGTEGW